MNRKIARELMEIVKEFEATGRSRQASWGFDVDESDDGGPDWSDVVRELQRNGIAGDIVSAIRLAYSRSMDEIESGEEGIWEL